MVGVCADPVTAQVMMTFLDRATGTSGRPSLNDERSTHYEQMPHHVKRCSGSDGLVKPGHEAARS
jgi:hypothetical protein